MLTDLAKILLEKGLNGVKKTIEDKKINEAFCEAILREVRYNENVVEELLRAKNNDQVELSDNLTNLIETRVFDDICKSYIPLNYIFNKKISGEIKLKTLREKRLKAGKSIEKMIESIKSEKELIQMLYHKMILLKNYTKINKRIIATRLKNIFALLRLYINLKSQ